MTLDTLRSLFEKGNSELATITHQRIAMFETISVNLTDSDKLVLTYNEKTDHLKLQLGVLIEVFTLSNLESWLLRQRILSLALETDVPLEIIENLTEKWE